MEGGERRFRQLGLDAAYALPVALAREAIAILRHLIVEVRDVVRALSRAHIRLVQDLALRQLGGVIVPDLGDVAAAPPPGCEMTRMLVYRA